jgi:hypothetical protein
MAHPPLANLTAQLRKLSGSFGQIEADLKGLMDMPRIKSLAAEVQRRSFRERLHRFYRRHNPSKLVDLESMVTQWAGKETELFAQLNSKYGSAGPVAVGQRQRSDGSAEIILEFAAQGSLGFMFKKNSVGFAVHSIPSGSTAMQVGDVITHLNGKKVNTKTSQKQLGCNLRESPRPLRLTVKRLPAPLFGGATTVAPVAATNDDGDSDEGPDGTVTSRVRFLSECEVQEESEESNGDRGQSGERAKEGEQLEDLVEEGKGKKEVECKVEEGKEDEGVGEQRGGQVEAGLRWSVRCSTECEVKEKGGKHVLHQVSVHTGDETIMLQRRTRQFRMLQRDLEKVHPEEATGCQLPDIAFIQDFGKDNLATICSGLDAYLLKICSVHVLAQSVELEKFLDDTAIGVEKWRTGEGGGIGGKATAIDAMLDGVALKEVRIGRKEVLEVPMHFASTVSGAGGNTAEQTLVWSFETVPNEVQFSLLLDGVEQSKSKARSAVRAVQGKFMLPTSWTPSADAQSPVCTLRFDNSYSPIRSKKLRYRATIVSDELQVQAGKKEGEVGAKWCAGTNEERKDKVLGEGGAKQEVSSDIEELTTKVSAEGAGGGGEAGEAGSNPLLDQTKEDAADVNDAGGDVERPNLTTAERALQYKEQQLQRKEDMLVRQQQGLLAEVERLRMEQEIFEKMKREGGGAADETWREERYY